MFQKSYVHHQDDHLYKQYFMVCFSCIYVVSLAGGRMCRWSSWRWTYDVRNMQKTPRI